MAWYILFFKGDFNFGESQNSQGAKSGLQEAETSGWFDVSQKHFAQDVMGDQVHCCDKAASHRLLTAAGFWIIQIVSEEECSSLMQNFVQICCSIRSVILNVMATQYTCSLNGIYHPHWLVQWCCHCAHMCIPVHSPLLPGHINVVQSAFIILTKAGLFWTDLMYVYVSYIYFS